MDNIFETSMSRKYNMQYPLNGYLTYYFQTYKITDDLHKNPTESITYKHHRHFIGDVK